ncbi:MAG: DMT family transporter [Parafannyhessea sp.]|uniref:DMT family transporter n=1 Tax=Parafannyhessea sp. TaxID=2847324 RepID=UPI003F0AB2E0
MTLPKNIPSWAYAAAVVLTTVAYGSSYVVMKDALRHMPTSWFLALRFALAAVVLALLFRGRIARCLDPSHVVAGACVGVPEALGFLLQNLGLTGTTPGRNAFLTATYCVMVPFLAWAVERRRPGANNVAAALLCLAGVGLLSLGGTLGPRLGTGDLLTLVSALAFACNMVAVGRLGRAHDAVTLTFVMFVVSALVCLAWAVALEPVPAAAALTPAFWLEAVYITLLCTVFGLLVQNVAQAHLPSSEVALLLSFESVFATLFSVLFYGEAVTPSLLAGFALIFGSVLVSQFGAGRSQVLELEEEVRDGRL